MVRFLRSIFYEFETREELDRFLFVERLVALLHIPASICLAVGALAGAGVIPYATAYESHLILAASLFLVVSNAREANECVRNVFIPEGNDEKWNVDRNMDIPIRKLRPTVGDQMHMFAAFMMTLGSLSLFNSSLIALMKRGSSPSVTSRRQYALAFCLYLVGAAGNNLATERALRFTRYTRVLLSFQNVICSASFGISGLLMLPSLSRDEEDVFRTTALTVSVTLGSFLAVLSAVMQYFHTLASAWAHVNIFERKKYEKELEKDGYESQEQVETRRGYLRRLRDVFKTRGKSLIWRSAIQEDKGHEMEENDVLRRSDAGEGSIDPDLISGDEYDGSSFSSIDTSSDSLSWLGDNKPAGAQEGHATTKK